MAQRSRLIRLCLLLTASPLVGLATAAYVQDNHPMDMAAAAPAVAMKSVRGSDPLALWQGSGLERRGHYRG